MKLDGGRDDAGLIVLGESVKERKADKAVADIVGYETRRVQTA